jgi:predicted HTH transcriptional regulator
MIAETSNPNDQRLRVISSRLFEPSVVCNSTEGDLQDRKQKLYQILSSKEELAEYIKDLIALANSARMRGRDSYLIFGVTDTDRKIVGIEGQDVRSPARHGSFDQLSDAEIERFQNEIGKDLKN